MAYESEQVDQILTAMVDGKKLDYLHLLEHSYNVAKKVRECPPETRFAFLSNEIFDFTTYDSEKDELFGRKAVEVCQALNNKKTFDYVTDAENYNWFLVMCNMPFFVDKLDWGTSIRGAWWGASFNGRIEFQSSGLWDGDVQLWEPIKFKVDDWRKFIAAVIEFAKEEIHAHLQKEKACKKRSFLKNGVPSDCFLNPKYLPFDADKGPFDRGESS